ncbi:cell wall integrity and stress response component 2-like [Haliotis rufescens]|uniref:cell wall integrity and stress response component 2-like n=1 Tax=Haliotis rufescens TaxID=6454 RepID=UPI00201EDD1D|nr:cell wall integrity and stress response component 2-like [Haliotis rufescens]
MDVLLTLVVLTLPSVTSGLQTCSSGTETSSNQVLLDLSTTQINRGGGMCSCRLTVSQTAQVDVFSDSWTQQCDTYMTIEKWRTSSQCTNGIVQSITGLIHTVNTGEEIWILVVATPGARGLSGQLQFKLKSSSAGQLKIECFEPNSNSSTTTTLSTTSVSTSSSTLTTTTSPQTTAVTTTTERLISTSQPTTETQRPTSITLQGQTTYLSTGVTAGAETTKATTTQIPKKIFPGGIFAAGVATGAVLVVIAGGLYVAISRRWWRSRQKKSDDIPVSEVHPTYSGLKPRTQEPSNTYDIIDPNPSKGTANPYINVP